MAISDIMVNKILEQNEFIKSIKSITTPADNSDNINMFKDIGNKPLEIMIFTGYSEVDDQKRIINNKGNIKELFSSTAYRNVQIIGIGLSNYRGIYCPIKTDELVLVGWLDKNTPIILGNVNDYINQIKDNIPRIKEDEIVIAPKALGSVIYIKDDGTIILKTKDGSKIRLNNNGHFKIFNKDNFGIECDQDGNLILRGVTITSTNTAGDF